VNLTLDTDGNHCVTVPISKLTKNITINVEISGMSAFKWKLRVSKIFFAVGVFILGANLKFVEKEIKDA
jgi:hypothetical protein